MYSELVILFETRLSHSRSFISFFFNDTAPTEIYTLSLHDALPILQEPLSIAAHDAAVLAELIQADAFDEERPPLGEVALEDRKSTRLNSSHQIISYAVFCLKKKKKSQHDKPHMRAADAQTTPELPH